MTMDGWRTPVILISRHTSPLVGTRHRLPFDERPCSQQTVMRLASRLAAPAVGLVRLLRSHGRHPGSRFDPAILGQRIR